MKAGQSDQLKSKANPDPKAKAHQVCILRLVQVSKCLRRRRKTTKEGRTQGKAKRRGAAVRRKERETSSHVADRSPGGNVLESSAHRAAGVPRWARAVSLVASDGQYAVMSGADESEGIERGAQGSRSSPRGKKFAEWLGTLPIRHGVGRGRH